MTTMMIRLPMIRPPKRMITMPEERERESGQERTDTYEKLGIQWLQDLHHKSERIRALQMRLVSTIDDISDDEAMELVSRIGHMLNILLEQEIRPCAENRQDWDA